MLKMSSVNLMSNINTKFIFKTMEYKNLTAEMDKNFWQKLKDRENKMHVHVPFSVPKNVL